MLLVGLGILGIFLAAVGLFSVVSYRVSRRLHEIGVRMALGAPPREIQFNVLMDSLRLSITGVAIGFVAAIGIARFMASRLYGVTTHDPTVYAASALLVTAITLVAA